MFPCSKALASNKNKRSLLLTSTEAHFRQKGMEDVNM